MSRHRISPDRPPGDLAGTCSPDLWYDLRILIAEHRPGRHDDARVDVFFQHVFRDAKMLVLFGSMQKFVGFWISDIRPA